MLNIITDYGKVCCELHLKINKIYRILSKYSVHFVTLKMMLKYTWKVAEKGFKIAFMMNKLAMIISFEIILE